ncbi:MAG TPA: polysaccharide biosynthesis/export family protein [Pyrinomonadaceae bacterium]|nr:polysaccharide biosynthesis/export family protein [Pyrinomonadaceae bacterium]
MKTLFFFLSFFLFGLSFCNAVQAQLPVQSDAERYRIGFQDRLAIQVFRHPELSQTIDVNPNGTINLFRLAEPVSAVCKTERQLADDIATAYRQDYLRNPEVNVVVTEQRSRAFAVIGAVDKPANYMINRRVKLLELLAYAGGPTREAGSRLIVARTGSTSSCKQGEQAASDPVDFVRIDYKLKDVLEGKENPEMRPGDIVSVLESDSVYVYGNVVRQGQVKFKEPITLMQAISSAEGVKSAANKDKVRVFRQKVGSADRDEFIYDLGKIAKREAQDPYLEPNDVIAVSEDQAKSIFQSIGRSLTGGLPSLFYRIP